MLRITFIQDEVTDFAQHGVRLFVLS